MAEKPFETVFKPDYRLDTGLLTPRILDDGAHEELKRT
jgi:hypothetical protein